MGLAMRVVFAALDVLGELTSLQMGLSFATFFDPGSNGQTAVVGEFLTLLATLIFLALNGHLLMADVLARSFEWLPVNALPLHAGGWAVLVRFGAVTFSAGLLLALPVVTALLITNIALGILTRAAPGGLLASLRITGAESPSPSNESDPHPASISPQIAMATTRCMRKLFDCLQTAP